MTDDRYLSTEEAATYLGVHRKSIPRWRRDGTFPDPDFWLGRSPGWRRETLDQWRRDTGRE